MESSIERNCFPHDYGKLWKKLSPTFEWLYPTFLQYWKLCHVSHFRHKIESHVNNIEIVPRVPLFFCCHGVLGLGTWLSEACLWIHWVHNGIGTTASVPWRVVVRVVENDRKIPGKRDVFTRQWDFLDFFRGFVKGITWKVSTEWGLNEDLYWFVQEWRSPWPFL